MLAMQLAFVFFMQETGRGQTSFTPVPYNFPNSPLVNSTGFTDQNNINHDLLNLLWTASNGYGIWGVVSGPAGGVASGRWCLLSNELQNESTLSASTISPSGAIAEGDLGYIGHNKDIKVAANLQGQVRYVWPDESIRTGHDLRDQFVVKGFDNPDIHINFSGIPQIANSRNVIYSPVTNYPIIPTGAGNKVANFEFWLFDHFDIAMDAKYLYIVWVIYKANTDGTLNYQIWATAQLLSSPYTIEYAPHRIDGGTDPNNGSARRPTVDCDRRNSPNSPAFDVAFISNIPDPGQGGVGSVCHSWVHNGIFEEGALNNLVLKSTALPLTPVTYSGPVHARMLVSSVPGVTVPVKGIYAIVYSPGNLAQLYGALIFHKIFNNTIPAQPYAWYIDGADSPPLIKNSDHEEPLNIEPGSSDVINEPIQAFANPYDGAVGNTYDAFPGSSYMEFHCLYKLNIATTPVAPLLIVHGIDNAIFSNGSFAGVSPKIINRTRIDNNSPWVWLDPSIGTPGVPLICVNQMGIHTYWRSISGLIYSRDMRSFDEPIEENTLVTDSCIVADGSSSGGNHAGTKGAALQPGKTMTFWTDPNYGVNATNQTSGVYIADPSQPTGWRNARISLVGNGVTLDIAGTTGAGNQAYLITLPNFQFQFLGSGQSLIIHSYSVFDYYGLPQGTWNVNSLGPVVTNFTGTGTIELRGGSVTPGGAHDPPTALSAPAALYIHAGANFKLPETVSFLSTGSSATYLFQSSIVPVWATTTNPLESGVADFHGPATFTNSWTTMHIPTGLPAQVDVLSFNNCIPTGCTSVTAQLHSANSLFQNIANPGSATGFTRLRIIGASNQTIDGGRFDGTGIRVEDPVKVINFKHASFIHIQTRAIDYLRTSSAAAYDHIITMFNDFGTFGANAEAGIFADGFDVNADFEKLWIEQNTFTTSTGQSGSNGVTAAIHLVNSSGTVLRNTISGTGYKNGIINESPSLITQTNTFFCSNNISNCLDGSSSGAGLTTQNWKGYSKLNELFSNDIGHLSQDNENGGIDFCHYHENNGAGLKLSAVTSKVNMSGVHHIYPDTDPDYAGWNTVDHNVLSGSNTGEIDLNAYAILLYGTSITASDDWGHNTLIANGASTTNHNFFLMYNPTTTYSVSIDLNINYFGYGASGSLTAITDANNINPTYFKGIGHSGSYNSADFQSTAVPYVIDFSVDCGNGFTNAHHKGNKIETLAVTDDTSSNECGRLQTKIDMLDQSGLYKQENDTGRHYIETCAAQKSSFHVFVSLDGAVQFMSADNNRWFDYREWLKKVLYLSMDTLYYCADANSILHTFSYLRPGQGEDYNGLIAIVDYLLQNNRCPDSKAYLLEGRKYNRDKQVFLWRDSVKDSIATPLDTTKPSLEDLGLGILRGPQNAVASSMLANKGNKLNSFITTKNPFNDATVLRYELSDAAALRLEIYDVLGREVYSEGEGIQEAGGHEIQLSGKMFTSGTYYARLTTLGDEVKTITLKHF